MTRRSRISVLTLAFFMSLALQAWFLPFAAHAEKLKGFSTFKVVDANGKELGIATANALGPNTAILVFEVGGQVFDVQVRGDGFIRSFALVFEFPDTTCSGTPLMRVSPHDLLTPVAIAPPGSTVYAPDPQAVPRTITEGSFFAGGSCVSSGFSGSAVPVVALVDLDTQFTPPFKIKR